MYEKRITHIEELIELTKTQIDIWSAKQNEEMNKLKYYKEQLVMLRTLQNPKFTTSEDFPCLDYIEGSILYNDGKNRYYMSMTEKSVCRWEKFTDVDHYVAIVECKITDIQPGDYFAIYINLPVNLIPLYKFCTKITDDILFYDFCENMYISHDTLRISSFAELEYKYVKFILLDKYEKNFENY